MIHTAYDYRRAVAEEINRIGGGYHQIDLGDGLIINGEYDMCKVLQYYNLPENLSGVSVLDIGTSTGFFAFECARRGGRVTAIDIWPPWPFNAIKNAIGLEIEYVQKNIYDLDASFGQFDLVICGSLLLHLRDIFGAIQKIREVCDGTAIVSTAACNDRGCAQVACCEFIGNRAADGDYLVYWGVNAAGLAKMLLTSGFSSVSEPVHFTLQSEPGRHNYATPHVVVSARV
jgi:2-polyprenyl-3-methyl-5-hydroxy-6-metoxy-1,4-benzoquinol methylase